MYMIPQDLRQILHEHARNDRRITVLSGAGISAESGIPTFRGAEGYWKVGSQNYQPEEMATQAMFRIQPREVWKWYAFRRSICRAAQPNSGHDAVVKLERLLLDRFTLITQNVDGLHIRAGNSVQRSYLIHGNLDVVRCSAECSDRLYPFPEIIGPKERGEDFTDDEWNALRCPDCEALARPHVLWFDEYYNERHYRWESSLRAAEETELLIVVGTSGATSLPDIIVRHVIERGGTVLDVNIGSNPFAEYALASGRGFALQEASGVALPAIAREIELGMG